MTECIPAWAEIVKALPSIATAVTAIYGLRIAKAGLVKWHDETLGKRKTDLAEQALASFYEARDVFVWVRSRGILGGEGHERAPIVGESDKCRQVRDTYSIPIERLNRDKDVFAKLQTLRYAFAAHFGEETTAPFLALMEVHGSIITSASILMQIVPEDETDHSFLASSEPLRNTLGWGPRARPDEIDAKISQAIQDIEKTCRPALTAKPV